MSSHFPQGPRSPSKLISDVSEINVRFARRFPLFPNWTSSRPPFEISSLPFPSTCASLEARDAALATGMQMGMDSGFERLDAYLQKIS